MKIYFLTFLFTLLSACGGQADTWRKAEVYYIDWDVLTRASLSVERVRELADYKQTFRIDAPAVARLFELERLKPSKDIRQEDARVVLDLIDCTGQRHTYYASLFNLCSANNKLKRGIDEPFRKRIMRLAKQRRVTEPTLRTSPR
jgi:hypothetical protein